MFRRRGLISAATLSVEAVAAVAKARRAAADITPRPRCLRRSAAHGTDQCAPNNAWKLVIPESNDPVIASVARILRGKSLLITEARKIAAGQRQAGREAYARFRDVVEGNLVRPPADRRELVR